jgi:hypothetical protein
VKPAAYEKDYLYEPGRSPTLGSRASRRLDAALPRCLGRERGPRHGDLDAALPPVSLRAPDAPSRARGQATGNGRVVRCRADHPRRRRRMTVLAAHHFAQRNVVLREGGVISFSQHTISHSARLCCEKGRVIVPPSSLRGSEFYQPVHALGATRPLTIWTDGRAGPPALEAGPYRSRAS